MIEIKFDLALGLDNSTKFNNNVICVIMNKLSLHGKINLNSIYNNMDKRRIAKELESRSIPANNDNSISGMIKKLQIFDGTLLHVNINSLVNRKKFNYIKQIIITFITCLWKISNKKYIPILCLEIILEDLKYNDFPIFTNEEEKKTKERRLNKIKQDQQLSETIGIKKKMKEQMKEQKIEIKNLNLKLDNLTELLIKNLDNNNSNNSNNKKRKLETKSQSKKKRIKQ